MTLRQLIGPCKTNLFITIHLSKKVFDSGYVRDLFNLYRYELHKYQVMMIDCDEDGLHVYVKEVKQNDWTLFKNRV